MPTSHFFKVPLSYTEEHLDNKKFRAFVDHHQEMLMKNIIDRSAAVDWNYVDHQHRLANVKDHLTGPIIETFKTNFENFISGSTLNCITGFESFSRCDVILGVTQYIDNFHIANPQVQVLENEYVYHTKLKPSLVPRTIETLLPNIPLMLAVPFPQTGKAHAQMYELFDRCLELDIPLHLDGAWFTAARNITLDLSHPAIKSFASSMSKGCGISGWNRIGLRWTKEHTEDSISIMNDYAQISMMSLVVGNYFLSNLSPDHLWNLHGEKHEKICRDFGLTETDTIHMGMGSDGRGRGLLMLLKYLEEHMI